MATGDFQRIKVDDAAMMTGKRGRGGAPTAVHTCWTAVPFKAQNHKDVT